MNFDRLSRLKPVLAFQMNAILIYPCRFQITELRHTFKDFIAHLYVGIRPFRILGPDTMY